VDSIGSQFIEIFRYLHPKKSWYHHREGLCINTTCVFPIDDLDALNEMFDKLKKHIIEEKWRAAGWTLIEIND
jgi:hypothetical protein